MGVCVRVAFGCCGAAAVLYALIFSFLLLLLNGIYVGNDADSIVKTVLFMLNSNVLISILIEIQANCSYTHIHTLTSSLLSHRHYAYSKYITIKLNWNGRKWNLNFKYIKYMCVATNMYERANERTNGWNKWTKRERASLIRCVRVCVSVFACMRVMCICA